MIERRPALIVPFLLALLLHAAAAVCITRMAGPPSRRPVARPPEGRLRIELQPLPPAPSDASPGADPVPPAPVAAPVEPAPATPVPVAPTPPAADAPPAPPAMPASPVMAPPAPAPAPESEAAPSSSETPAAAAGGEGEGEGSGDASASPVPASAPSVAAAWVVEGQISPRYPLLSRLRGEEGCVVVRVALDAAGRANDAAVELSSGHAALDRAALNAVRRATWSVRPGATLADATTNARVHVPIDFRLERGEP